MHIGRAHNTSQEKNKLLYKQVGAVMTLLRHGADCRLRNAYGKTAIDRALDRNASAVVVCLSMVLNPLTALLRENGDGVWAVHISSRIIADGYIHV